MGQKDARQRALELLQKRRKGEVISSESEANESCDEYSDDGMDDFIEETEEDKAERLRAERKSGPSISTFFKGNLSKVKAPSRGQRSPDREAALKDDFFQNLVAQLDAEEQEELVQGEAVEVVEKNKKTNKKRAKKEEQEQTQQPEESESEPEFIPRSLASAFPAPAPESALNQLQVNNERVMEVVEDASEAMDFDDAFLDDEELKQLEKDMSFSIEEKPTTLTEEKPSTLIEQKSVTNTIEIKPTMTTMEQTIINTNPTDDDSRLVYWFDAYERQPNGPVYLFGKMLENGSLVPCCVVVEGMQRNLFFLPREQVDGEDVTFEALQQEVSEIAEKYGITKFGCKKVTRKYAFELENIPVEADYLKMVYPYAGCAALPSGLQGRTFSHVFGTNTGALEQFLVKRRIMGPCWLRVKGAALSSRTVSWCRAELTVPSPKMISVLEDSLAPPTPKMTALSLSLRTVVDPTSHTHEIVSISGLVYNDVDIEGSRGSTSADRPVCSAAFSVVRSVDEIGFTSRFTDAFKAGNRSIRVQTEKSEKALLGFFLVMLQKYDPDMICGHNFLGFDLGVLLHRMRACKVDGWSKIGRLNWSQWPKAKASGTNEASYAERQIACGRIICDTYLAAKDMIKAKNYALGTLVHSQLGLEREQFDYERVRDYFASPELVLQLLSGNEMDAYFISQLMFAMNILPLTLQLTRIAGNLWSRTLTGARAERNEFLLLHEFHNLKYICPDKQAFAANTPAFTIGVSDENEGEGPADKPAAKSTSSRRKPAYSGGLVLEPKKGFYDRIVLLLDFNSLYPSIIQEYNICFTSVQRTVDSEEVPEVPDSSLPQGVLPRILKSLVERRRAVKSMMKSAAAQQSPAQMASLNIRQQALKLTANSMYGCLGFSHSRFYAKPLAMLITAKGREILQSTVNLTRDVCQLDVIYGDTDSIMVNTKTGSLAEARLLGQKIKKAVNERYRLLEIELDGIFQKLLLLKKKKYAALVVEEERADGSIKTKLETKGLDLVRRDWCNLSVEISSAILNTIMEGEDSEIVVQSIHDNLRTLAQKLEAGEVPVEKFVISKNLTKDPAQYGDAASQPHVKVALRMRQRGLTAAAGDTIPYVICQNNTSNNSSMADCAYHPDELKKDESLRIDTAWYLQTQLHPPIARLCEHIEGTDASQLAACLGLDSRKYRAQSAASSGGDESLLQNGRFASQLSDEERFAAVEKLHIACLKCKAKIQFGGIVQESENCLTNQLNCGECKEKISTNRLLNAVLCSIKQATDQYEQMEMKCDDISCGLTTRRMGVYDRKCLNEGCRGVMRPVLHPSHMYTHLLYLKSLFSTDRLAHRLATKLTPNDTRMMQQAAAEVEPIRQKIEERLQLCQYPVIDLKEIFSKM